MAARASALTSDLVHQTSSQIVPIIPCQLALANQPLPIRLRPQTVPSDVPSASPNITVDLPFAFTSAAPNIRESA